MEAQLVFRQKVDTNCPYHPRRKVEFQCEDCDGTLICALCMTSEQHKRHVFKELQDDLHEKVRNIEIFIENIEHEKIPEINRHIKLIDDNILENKSTHESMIKKVTLHGERLKDEVDLQTGQHVSVLDKHKQENNTIYTKHRKRLITFKQQLQKKNKDIRKTCKSGTEIQVIDKESEIFGKTINIPVTPEINRLTFEPCANIQSVIQEAFGVVSSSKSNTKEGSGVESQQKTVGKTLPKTVEKGDSTISNVSKARAGITTRTSQTRKDAAAAEVASTQEGSRKLLDEPTLLSQFESPCQPWSLCPMSDNDMWILKYYLPESNDIYLVDHNGHVKKELKCTESLMDIAIHPHTRELYGGSRADVLNIVVQIDTTNGSARKVFHTESAPRCIAITSTGNFVIGMYYKIYVYTSTGTILHSNACWDTPRRISVSNDDRQVAVACMESFVVLDDKLLEMYEYKGHDVKPAGEERRGFKSNAAMFDSHTNLLVADFFNKEIHLLDGRTGELLRTLTVSGMDYPWCLALRYDGALLIGSVKETIHCIKYVQ